MDQGHVVVDGWGRLAAETTSQLRRAGVAVRAGGHAADAAELEAAGGGPLPALVVLAVDDAPPPWAQAPSMLAPWQVRGVPQLPVAGAGGGVVVGPLVVPGRSACLACTVTGVADAAPGPPPAPGAVVLGAAVATVTALGVLAGDLTLAGLSTELGGRGWTVTHRLWASRPGCGCAPVRMAG